MNKDKLYFFDFALLWCGAAISISEIMTGGLLAPLGFRNGLLAIILGHIIGTTIFIFAGIIGTRENVSAMYSTRISFGLYGSYAFSLLNVLQLIGWVAIMVNTAAQSMNRISTKIWSLNNITLWSFLIAVLIIILIACKISYFKKINNAAVILLLILTLVLGYMTFKNGSLYSSSVKGTMSFGSALELVITMPLSWFPMVADYTKMAADEKQGALGSFLGYFIGSSWMFIIGLTSGIVFKNSDPSFIMIAANLGIIGFGIVVLSTVTTAFMDAYSAGISFLNIMPKFNKKAPAILLTILGTVLSLIFNINNYSSFLYAIGSVFAPLFAVLLTDYFIKKRTHIDNKLLLDVGAAVVWIIGVAVYYIFIKFDFIFGATLPSMIITSILYILIGRYIDKWKLTKN